MGDFNAVTRVEERKGRNDGGLSQEIKEYYNFIVDMELIDVAVAGKKFSWFCSDDISLQESMELIDVAVADRFLVTERLMARWNITGQWIDDRGISDHCPI